MEEILVHVGLSGQADRSGVLGSAPSALPRSLEGVHGEVGDRNRRGGFLL